MIGDQPDDIDDGTHTVAILSHLILCNVKELTGAVNVEKVTFAYPARPEVKVAKGLNLRVEPGEAIALVGASGCGKSTVIQLLERFYAPDSGQVVSSSFHSEEYDEI